MAPSLNEDEPSCTQEETVVDSSFPKVPGLTLISKLDGGSSGTVYVAEHQTMNQRVAVKILHSEAAKEEAARTRFQREAQILSKLRHPNIVFVYSFGITPENDFYIVMDYIEGATLAETVQKKGALTASEACSIVEKLAEALSVAHQAGIVHRDIKPSNIMLRSNDKMPILLDFGVAKQAASTDSDKQQKLTTTAAIVGTPAFMSPEQARGKAANELSDIYSLSSVLYFLLAGQELFSGDNALEIILKHSNEPPPLNKLKVSNDLRSILSTGLAKKPEDRFADMQQFADRLDNATIAVGLSMNRGLVLFSFVLCGIALAIFISGQNVRSTKARVEEKQNRLKDQRASIKLCDDAQAELANNHEKKALIDFQEFLRSDVAQTDVPRRFLALEKICGNNSIKSNARELLAYAQQMSELTHSSSFTKNKDISDRDKNRGSFTAEYSMLTAYLLAGQQKEALECINKLESVVRERAMRNHNSDYRIILAKLEYCSKFQNDVAAFRKLAAQAMSMNKIKAIQDTFVRSFFHTVLEYYLHSSDTTDDYKSTIKEAQSFLTRHLSENTFRKQEDEIVHDTYYLLLKAGKTAEASRFLNNMWALIEGSPSVSLRDKLSMLKDVMVDSEHAKVSLTISQTLEFKERLIKYLEQSKKEHEELDADNLIFISRGIVLRLLDLKQSKQVVINFLNRLEKSLRSYKHLPTHNRLELDYLLTWAAEGSPTLSPGQLTKYKDECLEDVKAEANDHALEQWAASCAVAVIQDLIRQKREAEAQQFFEQVWAVLRDVPTVPLNRRENLIFAYLLSFIQNGDKPISDARLEFVRAEFLRLAKCPVDDNSTDMPVWFNENGRLLVNLLKRNNKAAEAEEFAGELSKLRARTN